MIFIITLDFLNSFNTFSIFYVLRYPATRGQLCMWVHTADGCRKRSKELNACFQVFIVNMSSLPFGYVAVFVIKFLCLTTLSNAISNFVCAIIGTFCVFYLFIMCSFNEAHNNTMSDNVFCIAFNDVIAIYFNIMHMFQGCLIYH